MGKYKHPVPGFCYFLIYTDSPDEKNPKIRHTNHHLVYNDMTSSSTFRFLGDDDDFIEWVVSIEGSIQSVIPAKPFYTLPTTDLRDFFNVLIEEKKNPLV